MGVISDISSLLVQAYKLWHDAHSAATLSPQELYDKYASPSYQLLRQAHDDYIQLYMELEERLALETTVSDDTIRWFSRARAKRQVDRSELRLFATPSVATRADRARTIEEALTNYGSAIRKYFVPADAPSDSLRERLDRWGPTASTATEKRLRLMQNWQAFSIESRRALAAEQHIETSEGVGDRSTDAVIEGVLEGVAGQLAPGPAKYLATLDSEAVAALREIPLERKRFGFDRYYEHLFDWRGILDSHIRRQRRQFETAMAEVQRAYILLRILCDRQ